MEKIQIPQLVKIHEFAKMTGLSRATIDRKQADGSIPKAAYILGGNKFRAWTIEQVAEVLESMRNPQAKV